MADKIPKDFSDAARVMAILDTMQTAENMRAEDRALIDVLFNGKRPFTDEEVKKYQIRINVNWNEGNKILQDANRQVNNATLYPGKFVTLQCNDGPIEERDGYSIKLTNLFNRWLKKKKLGKKHMFIRKSRNASFCLHGIGPLMWTNPNVLLPRFIPLEDILIPTDTSLDLCNLPYFGVNMYLTQSEFYELSHADVAQKGWNKPMVKAVLNALSKPDNGGQTMDWWQQPEKWQENFKQNKCYYDADSAPRVKLRWFLFQGKNDKKWYRRIVLREFPAGMAKENTLPDGTTFGQQMIFDSDEPFANDIDEILHVQFGDCSIVPPLRVHSVRGLGVMLYSIIECMNRLRCQFTQHVFDALATWIRIQNPADRARQQKVELFPYTVIEEGVEIVPKEQRHQVQPGLVESAMAQFRQLMSENSASFVQDINDGTQKEMTATEAQARQQSVNVMVGGMLQSMLTQEVSYFEELLRRSFQKNPTDPEIVAFQKEVIRDGIPKDMLDADKWDVEIEKVMGAGDNMLAQQEVTALMAIRQNLDPEKQRKVDHKYVEVFSRNPDMANELVPITPPKATDGTRFAESLFGTLMEGIPVSVVEGIDQKGYVEAMIGMMSAKVGQIEQSGGEEGGVGTPEDIVGLATVANDIEQHIALIAMNPANKQEVKQYSDALGQLMNMVKAFAQRLGEQMQAQQGTDEDQAKAQSILMLAQTKSQTQQAQALQKLQQNQAKFDQKMKQTQVKDMQKMQADIAKLQSQLLAQQAQTQADIAGKAAQTEADIAATKAKAKATPKAKKPPE